MIGQVNHPKSPKLNARERKHLRKDKERQTLSGSMVNMVHPHRATVSLLDFFPFIGLPLGLQNLRNPCV